MPACCRWLCPLAGILKQLLATGSWLPGRTGAGAAEPLAAQAVARQQQAPMGASSDSNLQARIPLLHSSLPSLLLIQPTGAGQPSAPAEPADGTRSTARRNFLSAIQQRAAPAGQPSSDAAASPPLDATVQALVAPAGPSSPASAAATVHASATAGATGLVPAAGADAAAAGPFSAALTNDGVQEAILASDRFIDDCIRALHHHPDYVYRVKAAWAREHPTFPFPLQDSSLRSRKSRVVGGAKSRKNTAAKGTGQSSAGGDAQSWAAALQGNGHGEGVLAPTADDDGVEIGGRARGGGALAAAAQASPPPPLAGSATAGGRRRQDPRSPADDAAEILASLHQRASPSRGRV